MNEISQISGLFSQFIGTLFEDKTLLVLLLCFVVGAVVKTISQIPNEAIPCIVVLSGALSMVVIDNHHTPELSLGAEKFAAGAVGAIIGFLAWLVHRYFWKPILNKIIARFGGQNGDDGN